MKEKILLHLSGLSARERALLFITILILGFFLGIKMGQTVLENFFDYDLSALQEQKRLNENSKALYVGVQEQKRQIDELNKLLSHFNADEKGYLDELFTLANAENINFTSFKNSVHKEANFAKHSLFIDFESDFTQSLAFLQAIQHSPLFFEFKEVKFSTNEQSKTLQTFLHLRFVVIK